MNKEPFFKFKQQISFFLELFSNEKIRHNVYQAIPFWIASLLAGLVAVGYARLFSLAEHGFLYVFRLHNWSVFILLPLCLVISWWIVQQFDKNAKGSGIPQVLAAIDLSTPKHANKVNKLLSLRIIVTKIISNIVMVLGGAAVGREGPTVQVSASVFQLVNKWIPKTWPKLSKQSFILTGAAAGLAAAFNTPLGGVVFAMEELARIHVRFFRTALFSAVIIAGMTAQGFLGPYLYLGYPDVSNLSYSIFFAVALTAFLSGLTASAVCTLILKAMKWRQTIQKPLKNIFFLICSGLIMAVFAYFVTPRVLGSGKDLMMEVLFSNDKEVSWYLAPLRALGSLIAFISGGSGGVFAPALATGAALGSYIAGLLHFIGANANILILSGMVGFLTGVTRTPFTSAILVLEMTDRHSVIFHLMLAAMVSNIAALLVDQHSLYEQLKHNYIEDAVAEETPVSEPALEN